MTTDRTPSGALARVCYLIESDSYSAEGFLYIGGFVYKVEVNAGSRSGALSALDDALQEKNKFLTSSATSIRIGSSSANERKHTS